jgi:hypothetical protein
MTQRTFGDYGPPKLGTPAPAIVPAQNFVGLQIGSAVTCTDGTGRFRRCACGSTNFVVAPGAGPHAAQLQCNQCVRGGRWLRRCYFVGVSDAP